MLKYTIDIGLNDKITKTQLISNAKALDIIVKTAQSLGLGYTILGANNFGGYQHHDKTYVNENSIKIEFCYTKQNRVLQFCEIVKVKLNQETLQMVKQRVKLRYV